MLEQIVHHDRRRRGTAQLQHDPHTLTIGLVPYLRHPFHSSRLNQFSDPLDQSGFVDLERYLSEDDAFAVLPWHVFEFSSRLDYDASSTGCVSASDTFGTPDMCSGWKIWSLDVLHQFVDRSVRISNQPHDSVANLRHVVRRNVGGHAHRDARRAIYEQVWEPGRKN